MQRKFLRLLPQISAGRIHVIIDTTATGDAMTETRPPASPKDTPLWLRKLAPALEGYAAPTDRIEPQDAHEAVYDLLAMNAGPKGAVKIDRRCELRLRCGPALASGMHLGVRTTTHLFRGDMQVTAADLRCRLDPLLTPDAWQIASLTMDYQGNPAADTRWEGAGESAPDGTIRLYSGHAERTLRVAPAWTCNWSLLAALPRLVAERADFFPFDLLEDLDLLRPGQYLVDTGRVDVPFGPGRFTGRLIRQVGPGVLPWHYGVDPENRLVFAVGGLCILLLRALHAGTDAAADALPYSLIGERPGCPTNGRATPPAARAPAIREDTPPNLLFIHTDQQSFDTIAAWGCAGIRTPHLDRLAASGLSFQRAYSADPVCCPARTCWYTGRMPSETGVVLNGLPLLPEIPDLGQWLGTRGYDPVYIGKWHVPYRDQYTSFRTLHGGTGIGEHSDGATARAAQAFLMDRRSSTPFFLSLGFLQPHDICYWIRLHRDDLQSLPVPEAAVDLPALPPNFYVIPEESATFRAFKRTGDGATLQDGWSELHWRYYLWSYHRHVEMVDAQIGRVLDALEASGHAQNTLVVFTSDHGEGSAHHRLLTKSILYDDTARVPLIVAWPGHVPAGVQNFAPVSGVDLAPTFCDYAGVEPPPQARGESLRPLLEGKASAGRGYAVAESYVTGRMVRTERYKYITYQDDSVDQLFNLEEDPGETRNLASASTHAGTLAEHRRLLSAWEARLTPAPVPPEGWHAKKAKKGGED